MARVAWIVRQGKRGEFAGPELMRDYHSQGQSPSEPKIGDVLMLPEPAPGPWPGRRLDACRHLQIDRERACGRAFRGLAQSVAVRRGGRVALRGAAKGRGLGGVTGDRRTRSLRPPADSASSNSASQELLVAFGASNAEAVTAALVYRVLMDTCPRLPSDYSRLRPSSSEGAPARPANSPPCESGPAVSSFTRRCGAFVRRSRIRLGDGSHHRLHLGLSVLKIRQPPR